MKAGIGTPGAQKVRNSPMISPPRTFTAPISVIPASTGLPPAVSRSTTTNVVWASDLPMSEIVRVVAPKFALSARGTPGNPEAWL